MAHATLPSLPTHSFPQVLTLSIERLLAQPQLGSCDYCDEYVDCRADAVVHDLSTDQEFCVRHFAEVSRG